MKHIIKVAKAIPWVLLGRLSFKLLKFLGIAAVTVLVFSFKVIAALAATEGKKPEVDEDEDLFDIGSYPSRPDLAPFRPK